ncbi:hypothetical protein LTR37_005206 [Vermiconidia calcicola]|uniref:Uncharacterized protein n=1 Tax=Vermiconidia calcicola TaxID=1690605 RepID=A0ACC3NLF5_9PEZI|nr:hypothetical protein LTR37_005206 [Vermiconidia calcicola]
MATRVPAKSILKQQTSNTNPTLSDEQKAQAERDRKNLGIALRHASRIQYQKDVEATILSHIETLLDFPAVSSSTSSEASRRFITLVQPFQPSDFDNLVEERRIDGKCGYALCSNAPRSGSLGANVSWKLKAEGAGDYCSTECVRKALYVKAQLSEVPAWEREPHQQPQIVLHKDDRPRLTFSGSEVKSQGRTQVVNRHHLALERGETATSLKPNQVMTPSVVEKAYGSVKPASNVNMSSSHTAIEGYEPASGSKRTGRPNEVQHENDSDAEYLDTSPKDPVEQGEDDSWRDLFSNIERG